MVLLLGNEYSKLTLTLHERLDNVFGLNLNLFVSLDAALKEPVPIFKNLSNRVNVQVMIIRFSCNINKHYLYAADNQKTDSYDQQFKSYIT